MSRVSSNLATWSGARVPISDRPLVDAAPRMRMVLRTPSPRGHRCMWRYEQEARDCYWSDASSEYIAYTRTQAQPASASLARRICVHIEYAFTDALNYAMAPGLLRGNGGTLKLSDSAPAQSQLCCLVASLCELCLSPCPLIICRVPAAALAAGAHRGQLRSWWFAAGTWICSATCTRSLLSLSTSRRQERSYSTH